MYKFLVLAAILLLSHNNYAQSHKPFSAGSWELNISADLGSFNSSSEYQGGGMSGEDSDDESYFQLHLIPGIFLTEGLSFEPEIDMLFVKEEKPSFSFLPNISYTYRFASNPGIALYARAGYGVSNSYSLFNMLMRSSNDLDITILNLGAGLKFLITDSFVLRTEVNYRSSSLDREETFYGTKYSSSFSLSQTRLIVGLSVLL